MHLLGSDDSLTSVTSGRNHKLGNQNSMHIPLKVCSDQTQSGIFTQHDYIQSQCKSTQIRNERRKYAYARVENVKLGQKICVPLWKPVSVEILLTSPRFRNGGQTYCHCLRAEGATWFNVFSAQRRNKNRRGLGEKWARRREIHRAVCTSGWCFELPGQVQGSNWGSFGRGWWRK